MGRRTKSILPITPTLLQPKTISSSLVIKNNDRSKLTQKKNHDKNAKPLCPLYVNDSVRIRSGKIWEPAKIINKHDERSYSVVTQDGTVYRRNRQHLLKTEENFSHFDPMQLNIFADPVISKEQT
jgi:hypothetical protein